MSRRRLLALGVAAVIAVAAAVAIPSILLTGGESGPKVALPVTENTLLRVDAQSGEPVAAVPLGTDPTFLEAAEGAVWVLDKRDESILRIDPERSTITRTIGFDEVPVPTSGLLLFRVGSGRIWLDGTWAYDLSDETWSEPGRGWEWLLDLSSG